MAGDAIGGAGSVLETSRASTSERETRNSGGKHAGPVRKSPLLTEQRATRWVALCCERGVDRVQHRYAGCPTGGGAWSGDTGIRFCGSTNGIAVTVATRRPHSLATITLVPVMAIDAGSQQ